MELKNCGKTAVMRALLMASLAPIFWGTNLLVYSEFVPQDAPLLIGFLRCAPIGLLMVLLFGRKMPMSFLKIAALGICNITIFMSGLHIAGGRLNSGFATTLIAASPLVVVFLAWPVLKRRPRMGGILAALLGFIGVSVTVLDEQLKFDVIGLLACVVALLSWAIGTVYTAKWERQEENIDMLSLTAWQLLIGGVLLLPFGLISGESFPVFDAAAVGAMLYIAFFLTGIAYLLWFRALAHLSVVTVSMLSLLSPLIAYFLDAVWLLRFPGVLECVGASLILLSIVWQTRAQVSPAQFKNDDLPETVKTEQI